jgi:hypothetical protein
MKKILFILTIFLIVQSCKNAGSSANKENFEKIHRLEWLVGNWEFEIDEGLFAEKWVKLNDSVFSGIGYMLIGEDTATKEILTIELINDELYYVALVSEQNNHKEVAFKLVSDSDNSFVFENKKHDFPQRIIYKYIDNNSFTAVIEGEIEGEENTTELFMSRVNR